MAKVRYWLPSFCLLASRQEDWEVGKQQLLLEFNGILCGNLVDLLSLVDEHQNLQIWSPDVQVPDL